jgi:hypothetical protein
MSEKDQLVIPFCVRLTKDEYETLDRLSAMTLRSKGSVIRHLLKRASEVAGMFEESAGELRDRRRKELG